MTQSMITVDLARLGPVEFDTLAAAVYRAAAQAEHRVDDQEDTLHRANGERPSGGRGRPSYRKSLDETIAEIEAAPARPLRGHAGKTVSAALDKYRELVAVRAALHADERMLHAAYDSRPWPRYMMTTGSDAHIHRDTRCQTCNRGTFRTQFDWLIDLSGTPVADAIATFKVTMCTVCFPDAPVVEVAPTGCQGTIVEGTTRRGGQAGYSGRVTTYGDCTCGKQGVRVNGSGRPYKHDPATPPAAAAVEPLALNVQPEQQHAAQDDQPALCGVPAGFASGPHGFEVRETGAPTTLTRCGRPADDPIHAGDVEAPVTLVPAFAPFDEIEHPSKPGVVLVVDHVTSAGRVIAHPDGDLDQSGRYLAAKCLLLRSADQVAAGKSLEDKAADLMAVARRATLTHAKVDLDRLRHLVDQHGFTVKSGGYVYDSTGYNITQGMPDLARMLDGNRSLALRTVLAGEPVAGTWAYLRRAEADQNAGRPLVDGDGLVVEPGTLTVTVEARVYFLGRVRGECGHYLAKSERRAGMRNCERCGECAGDDVDQDEPGAAGVVVVDLQNTITSAWAAGAGETIEVDQDDERPADESTHGPLAIIARYSRKSATLSIGPDGTPPGELLWLDAGVPWERDRALFGAGFVRVDEWADEEISGYVRATVRPVEAGDGIGQDGKVFRGSHLTAEQLEQELAAAAAMLQAAWSSGTAPVDRATAVRVMHMVAGLLREPVAAVLDMDGEPADRAADVVERLAAMVEDDPAAAAAGEQVTMIDAGRSDASAWADQDEQDASAVAGAVERQDDQVLTNVLQAAGEPVGEHAQGVEVPAQRPAAGTRADLGGGWVWRADGKGGWASSGDEGDDMAELRVGETGIGKTDIRASILPMVIETTREALRQMLRADGFVPGFAPGVPDFPMLVHPSGVAVSVEEGGTTIRYPDENIADGEYGEAIGHVSILFGASYGALRDVAVGLVAVVGGTAPEVTASSAQVERLMALVLEYGKAAALGGDTRRGIDYQARSKQEAGGRYEDVRRALLELVGGEPVDQHVTRILEQEVAGHWAWECDARDAEGTGSAGAVEAVYLDVAGARIGDGGIKEGSQLEIGGTRYAVPDRTAGIAGRTAPGRIGTALRTAGYVPAHPDGYYASMTDGGIMVVPAAWGNALIEARAQVEEALDAAGHHGLTGEEIRADLGDLVGRLPMPLSGLLTQMYAEAVILADNLPVGEITRYYETGTPCSDCEARGENCLAHRTYEQRRRAGW